MAATSLRLTAIALRPTRRGPASASRKQLPSRSISVVRICKSGEAPRTATTPTKDPLHRVFGAGPCRTGCEVLTLSFAPDGILWSVEEPGVLRSWHLACRRQRSCAVLGELATLWCLSPDGRWLVGGGE